MFNKKNNLRVSELSKRINILEKNIEDLKTELRDKRIIDQPFKSDFDFSSDVKVWSNIVKNKYFKSSG